ncbi:MAG TPA: glycosyltransferase family 39 protein [Dongiaceae bacterium]|nr:glycosyltransferase family 39 protein [Dongiaceae bacterium]
MRREWAIVGAGFFVLALIASVWLAIDRRPPEWDHANHLERAVQCARDLRAGDVQGILERSSFYPPLVLCLGGVGMLLGLSDMAAGGAVMIAFLGLGMAAVYLLGRALGGGTVGIVAALLFGSAPFVVFSTLRFQLDLPLAAVVAVALVVLLATDHFRDRGAALAFGLVCGLGMLTKPTFALYVLVPVVMVLARGGRRGLLNAILAGLVMTVVSLPWFGPRLFGLQAQLGARAYAQAAEAGQPDAMSFAGVSFYPRLLINEFGLGASLLFVLGLVAAAVRRQWLVLFAVLAPFVVLAVVIQNKNLRYSLPLFGAMAVIAALALVALPRGARVGAAVALLVLAVAQVAAITTGVPPNVRIPVLGVPWVPSSPPIRTDWQHAQILALLERDRHGVPATVSVVPNDNFFAVSNFRYYAVRDRLDLRFVRAWDDPPLGIDYMILKTGDVGPKWTAEKSRRVADRLARDAFLARVFPVIGEFALPDGSTATVRARRISAVDAAPAAVAAAIEAALRRRLGDVVRDAEGLQIHLVYDDAIRGGRVARAEIAAAAAPLGEFARGRTPTLRLRDLRVVIEDFLVNPWSALGEGRLDPLDAGRVRFESATLALADLQAYVAGLPRFHRSVIAADGDALRVTVRQLGPDVSARVRLQSAADRPFVLVAERVRVGRVPVPDVLVNWVIRNYDPSARIAARLPFPVALGHISVSGQALRITGAQR